MDNEYAKLRTENARLVRLLDTHGIAWREPEVTTVWPRRSR
jgi:hypothetical protein